jgi:hypothetical protein
MLTDYIEPDERIVACPNQDVVYGGGFLALDASPVVIQVPDFGTRFWVYQVVDLHTDSFAALGKMYGTTHPGSICWLDRTGTATFPKGSPRCSAPRRTAAMWSRASFRTIRPRTSGPSRACSSRS